jgi:hypothetical protein
LQKIIIGKKLSGNVASAVQFLFMVMFMVLIVYVSFFDIRRLFGDHADNIEMKKRMKLQVPMQAVWEGMQKSKT